MRFALFLLGCHAALIALLFWVGTFLTKPLQENTWVGPITLLSWAVTLYGVAFQILYHKNPRIFLFVNRLFSLLRRTHTHWLPSFDFTLSDASPRPQDILTTIQNALEKLPHKWGGQLEPNGPVLCVFDSLYLKISVNESNCHLTLDRPVLVPSQLYDTFSHRLHVISETVTNAIHPEATQLGITITFKDGVANPYFGFFIQRVPPQKLRHFEATYLLNPDSECRIEVGANKVAIESPRAADFFQAIGQVLTLKAAPAEKGSP